jgi:hypothetical protein
MKAANVALIVSLAVSLVSSADWTNKQGKYISTRNLIMV